MEIPCWRWELLLYGLLEKGLTLVFAVKFYSLCNTSVLIIILLYSQSVILSGRNLKAVFDSSYYNIGKEPVEQVNLR